jgi:hypothetical protein
VLRLSRYPAHRGHDDRCVTAPPFDSPTLTVAILDLDKIAAVQSVRAGLDLHAKRFQLQRVFPPSLLECAKRVTHRFAGILVLPGLDDARRTRTPQRNLPRVRPFGIEPKERP